MPGETTLNMHCATTKVLEEITRPVKSDMLSTCVVALIKALGNHKLAPFGAWGPSTMSSRL